MKRLSRRSSWKTEENWRGELRERKKRQVRKVNYNGILYLVTIDPNEQYHKMERSHYTSCVVQWLYHVPYLPYLGSRPWRTILGSHSIGANNYVNPQITIQFDVRHTLPKKHFVYMNNIFFVVAEKNGKFWKSGWTSFQFGTTLLVLTYNFFFKVVSKHDG